MKRARPFVPSPRRPQAPWTALRPRVWVHRLLAQAERWFDVREVDRVRLILDRQLRSVRGTPWIDHEHFEVALGTWAGVLRIHDASGRLLGENHGLPMGAASHPTIVLRPAPFPGSRAGKPYNVSALRQMAGLWSSVRQLILGLRRAFVDQRSASTGPLSIVETIALARTVTAYPSYLLRRRHPRVVDGEIPEIAAAAFKVMAGVHSALEHLLEERGPTGLAPQALIGPDELYEYIERRGLFLSGEGRACGGPERMVRETLQIAIAGPTDDDVDRRSGDAAALPREQAERVVAYGRVVAAIELLLLLAANIQGNGGRIASPPPAIRDAQLEFRRRLADAARAVCGLRALAPLLAPLSTTEDPEVLHRAITGALDVLLGAARAHLDLPEAVSPVEWSTVERRIGPRPP